ncbi:hypothetical protein F5B21DRAFT_282134 [Xylaria acuta]|nr:hypothetical protein F5B21DRAFT_282134 [Xylaria acuta]
MRQTFTLRLANLSALFWSCSGRSYRESNSNIFMRVPIMTEAIFEPLNRSLGGGTWTNFHRISRWRESEWFRPKSLPTFNHE